MGHLNEEATRATAKHHKWNLTRGMLKNCESCAKGKGKQKKIAKESKHVTADGPGKRIFMDIKSMTEPKDKKATPYVAKPNLRMMVDEYSGCGFA